VNQDPYKILGIEPNATEEEIKRAYKKLASEYHPDKHDGKPEYAEKFKTINEAYSIIGNPESRLKHDFKSQHNKVKFQASHVWEDILKPFQNIHQASQRRPSNFDYPGDDVKIDTCISFKDSYFGLKRDFNYEALEECELCTGSGATPGTRVMTCGACGGMGFAQDPFLPLQRKCMACNGKKSKPLNPCAGCRGQGIKSISKKITINIPPGVDNGSILRIPGKGKPGNPPGDLFINIVVDAHPGIMRDGLNIKFQHKVPWFTLVTGADIEIQGPFGNSIRFNIPPESESNMIIQIPNAGFMGRNGVGNAIVEIVPVMPKNLSNRQKKLLNELIEDINIQ
jgi:molecular chaperone DnaJ